MREQVTILNKAQKVDHNLLSEPFYIHSYLKVIFLK